MFKAPLMELKNDFMIWQELKKKEFDTDTLKQEQHFISNQEFIL